MAKVEINGNNPGPVWRLIKETYPQPVDWNFAAWVLFDRDGNAVGRWGFSLQKMGDATFLTQVERAIQSLG